MDEEHDHRPGHLPAFLWVFDVTDLQNITALSAFNVSELDSPWARAPGRFGALQFREKLDAPLVFATWFASGRRVVCAPHPLSRKRDVAGQRSAGRVRMRCHATNQK